MPPELIAHRGASRERPENSLPAFPRALDLGADAIELDVHATRDRAVVVHHDAVPRARAGVTQLADRPIADLSLAQLHTFRLDGEERIPLLADVLRAVAGRATVYVEVKAAGMEREVVRVIRDSSFTERCAVHSFDHRIVRRVRSLAPGLTCGVLLVSRLVDTAAALRAAGAAHLWQQWEFLDAELIAEVHAARGRVIAWTVNDPRVAGELAAAGVDAICTDAIPALRPALAPA